MTKEEAVNKAIEIEFGLGNTRSIREHNSSLVKIAEHVYDLLRPSLPSNLDEVAEKYANKEFPDEPSCGQWGTGDYEPPVDMEYPREIAKNAFKDGAEWHKEQMMSEVVEGEVRDFRFIREINYSSAKIEFNSITKLKEGDRVCLIVLPKEN